MRSLALSLRNAYEALAISAPTVVDALRGRLDQPTCDARLESFAAHVIANAGADLTVHGKENVEPGRTYVLMSNHQSHYDIPMIYAALGGNIRMVAKKELFRIPVFGTAMRAAGMVELDRQNRSRAVASLSGAKKQLESGVHIWIAPEGTRSKSGELGAFKQGGFVIAMEAGAPILPMTIKGTRDILPSGAARTQTGVHVDLTIHPPIETSAFASGDAKADRRAVVEAVRAAIESAL